MGTALLHRRTIQAAVLLLSAAACQTTGNPAPVAASAPTYTKGETYTFAVIKDNRGPREFVRKFDGVREGNLVFLDANGEDNAIYTADLNPVRIGSRHSIPHGGMLKFPMNVGSSWAHPYTAKSNAETRSRARRCVVRSWEEVKVLAGTFMAFRISCDNQWSQASMPADEQYWYAPAAKNIVKYESREWYHEYQLKELKLSK